MGVTFKYSDPRGIEEPSALVALPSNVRYGNFALSMSAAVGAPAMSTIQLDDPLAEYDFQGLRALHVYETSAPSNNQMIGRFVIQDRVVSRGPSSITSNARTWSMDVTDYNWHLGKRVFTDSDAKRPAETPGDRIRWLLNRAAHINLNDYGNVTYPSTPVLEANDYRGQRPTDLLADCAIEGQYNYWCDFNEAHGTPELFFMDPDSGDYEASLYITNDPYWIDGETIFAPSDDATLRTSPSRIAYGVYVAYANGAVYARKDSTGEQFGKLDQTAPMANVKTETRARRLANRFLNQNDTENDVITCSIVVPLAKVNSVRHGHLIKVKFAHFPGYEDWTAMRVTQRTVAQEEVAGQTMYRIFLEMVGSTGAIADPQQAPYTGSAFAGLLGQIGTGDAPYVPQMDDTGDNPPSGFGPRPTVGDMWTFITDPATGEYTGIRTSRQMTVRVELDVKFRTVGDAGCTATVNILDQTQTYTKGTALSAWNGTFHFDFETTLSEGTVVDFTVSQSGFLSGGWLDAPATTYLYVGRGTQRWDNGATIWEGAS